MREEEAPQIADAKKYKGLCIFSSLPAIGFLHLCTQPLTPEILLLGHTVAQRQAPWTSFAGTLLQLRSLLPRLLVHRTGPLCHSMP